MTSRLIYKITIFIFLLIKFLEELKGMMDFKNVIEIYLSFYAVFSKYYILSKKYKYIHSM